MDLIVQIYSRRAETMAFESGRADIMHDTVFKAIADSLGASQGGNQDLMTQTGMTQKALTISMTCVWCGVSRLLTSAFLAG